MIKPHLRNGHNFSGLTIGLLGGSFNPAHDGHLAMSLHALKKLDLDQIWWLVSPQNPLKGKENMAAIDTRVRSAKRLATHPRLLVTALELELGTRITADTVRLLKARFSHTHFVWLMGADNLRQIPQWQNWQEIFYLMPVAVFRRPGYPAGRGLGQAAGRFSKAWRGATLGKPPVWTVLDNKLNYASATQIRRDNPTWNK